MQTIALAIVWVKQSRNCNALINANNLYNILTILFYYTLHNIDRKCTQLYATFIFHQTVDRIRK